MEPLMVPSAFIPSSKLRMRPKLVVASTSALSETPRPSKVPRVVMLPPAVHPQIQEGSLEATIPASHFYGVPSLASPVSGYVQEGEDRCVRFKSPLEEGTPLHIQQATRNEDRMEGIMEGNSELNSLPPPPSLQSLPIPLQTRPGFLPHPPTLPIDTVSSSLSSPASDPIDFPSMPDFDIGTVASAEEHPSPKWPRSQTPPSPSAEDSQSSEPESEEEEMVDQLAGEDSDDEAFTRRVHPQCLPNKPMPNLLRLLTTKNR
jgi:hypothetical protein